MTVTGTCFPTRLQHVPRRFLMADSGGQTQVAWFAYTPIILFLLLKLTSTFLDNWLLLCRVPFSTLTSMCRRNSGIEPRNAGVYS
jgi:hypothetical protein